MFGRIVTKLVESEAISAEDKEVYEYGLRRVASTFITIATTLVIGFIFGMILESVIFMAAYVPLRSYAGGYHARTPLRCYVFSVILTVLVLLSIKYIPYDIILIGALTLVAGIIVFIFAPVADANKPLDQVETRVFKKCTRIILFMQIVFGGLFWILGFTWIFICIIVSIAVVGVMVIIGVVNNIFKNCII